VDGTGRSACKSTCDDVPLACDDGADCGGGLVCCVDVFVNGDDSAGLKGSSCRAEADCQPSTASSGPTRLRACSPLDFAADCKGKGCGRLTSRYATLFPGSNISVCD
jgi:hypothetical protein